MFIQHIEVGRFVALQQAFSGACCAEFMLVTSTHVRLQNATMYAVAAFGLLTIIFGVMMMIISPGGWSKGILSFARKTYFHTVEVLSRLLVGGALVFFAGETIHPKIIAGVGYSLIFAGVFLVVAGAERHRAFAVRSANFVPIFRPAGFAALAMGAFVIFTALGRSFG